MRLIDADETLMDAEHMSAFRCSLANMEDLNILIGAQETIDAVPVVRCRECKHYDTADFDGNILCGCTLHSAMLDITPDSFCSYGERKGGAD